MSKKAKEAFEELAVIVLEMKRLNKIGIDENKMKDKVYSVLKNDKAFPIPTQDESGVLVGGVLALALEMNCYVVARHLVLNKDSYNIDLDNCAGSAVSVYNAQEILEDSLEEFEDQKKLENFGYTGKESAKEELRLLWRNADAYYYVKSLVRNIKASEELVKLLDPNKKTK